jgi:hypothetical protein
MPKSQIFTLTLFNLTTYYWKMWPATAWLQEGITQNDLFSLHLVAKVCALVVFSHVQSRTCLTAPPICIVHMNRPVYTRLYQKVSRLVPQTANRWQYVNECAVLGSRERHHSACRVASLCEHWELHNTSDCHHVSLHICDFSMDGKLEQMANIKFCVKLGKSGAEIFEMIRLAYRKENMSRVKFSSGTRASREAEHHSKTTRGQGELPRAQHLKMWKQFGVSCMRIVGEPLRTLLQSLMCHTE